MSFPVRTSGCYTSFSSKSTTFLRMLRSLVGNSLTTRSRISQRIHTIYFVNYASCFRRNKSTTSTKSFGKCKLTLWLCLLSLPNEWRKRIQKKPLRVRSRPHKSYQLLHNRTFRRRRSRRVRVSLIDWVESLSIIKLTCVGSNIMKSLMLKILSSLLANVDSSNPKSLKRIS